MSDQLKSLQEQIEAEKATAESIEDKLLAIYQDFEEERAGMLNHDTFATNDPFPLRTYPNRTQRVCYKNCQPIEENASISSAGSTRG